MKYSEWKRGYEEATVAWAIERVIKDRADNKETMKQHGRTHLGVLQRWQKRPLAVIRADQLTKQDIAEAIKERRREVGPATADQDLVLLSGAIVDYAATWDDLDLAKTIAAFIAARKYLRKRGLIAKANRRTQRYSDEQRDLLLTQAKVRDAHPRSKIRLADCFDFAMRSTRRRGEIVRITHGDVDYEKKLYWVRDLKHPTRKIGNHKAFVLWPDLEEIIKRQPRIDQSDPNEKIFPFDGNSLGAAFVQLKKACGITGVRFHDARADCISRCRSEKGMTLEDIRIMYSGHDTTKVMESNYDRVKPDEIALNKYPHLLVTPADIHAT